MRCISVLILLSLTLSGSAQDSPPTLADFWDGRAEWVLLSADVGLPVGESDTIARGDGTFWSYLHASTQSAGVIDQCGQTVAFPGCLTRWESTDGGQSFSLPVAVCSLPCGACPCDDQRDHTSVERAAQQYPRVVVDEGRYYMAYEWHAQVILRTSDDGLVWSDWDYLLTPGGTFPSSFAPCSVTETIGPHPNIRGQLDDCLVGAPPGLYIEGDTLYVFVAAGSAPAHMRCYKGDKHGDLARLERCTTDPLFSGASEYGPLDARGAQAHPYFDFRYVSSADVLKVGDRYYMAYEGIRGPEFLEAGMDTQYGLGFARSVGSQIDGPWERFPANPVLQEMGFWVGIGHADLLTVAGETRMMTQTGENIRGLYVLRWR
ncbi:MAG: hypothetical protein IPK52_17740 [Chloroflexi bacterium]|nr:hypothetical protein [Chloroflexota bacterium]